MGKLYPEVSNHLGSQPKDKLLVKADLKAKFLRHLNQKKQDEGFTLIELLLVIMFVGILSAIALPSFLSQSNKAKQAEGRTYVGSLNKGQQAHLTEHATFAESDISALGLGIKTSTIYYNYTTQGKNSGGITSTAINKGTATPSAIGLKGYAGMVSLIISGTNSEVTSISTLCEQKNPNIPPVDPINGEFCASSQIEIGQH